MAKIHNSGDVDFEISANLGNIRLNITLPPKGSAIIEPLSSQNSERCQDVLSQGLVSRQDVRLQEQTPFQDVFPNDPPHIARGAEKTQDTQDDVMHKFKRAAEKHMSNFLQDSIRSQWLETMFTKETSIKDCATNLSDLNQVDESVVQDTASKKVELCGSSSIDETNQSQIDESDFGGELVPEKTVIVPILEKVGNDLILEHDVPNKSIVSTVVDEHAQVVDNVMACSTGQEKKSDDFPIAGDTVPHIAGDIDPSFGKCSNLPTIEEDLVMEDINKADSKGNTPLILAVLSKNNQLVKELIMRGADPCLRDKIGMSAFDYGYSVNDHDLLMSLCSFRN